MVMQDPYAPPGPTDDQDTVIQRMTLLLSSLPGGTGKVSMSGQPFTLQDRYYHVMFLLAHIRNVLINLFIKTGARA